MVIRVLVGGIVKCIMNWGRYWGGQLILSERVNTNAFISEQGREYSRRTKEYFHRVCVDNLASVTGVWSHILRKL